ncbi:MAG: hypothetical protein JEZ02_15920 [Desulfatibacillum sp.]|nr:hypothetical protein [Desulfatibacillum sp.]
MPNNTKGAVIIIPALFLLLMAGIVHMFSLRFESGDVYPPYSSLRSDPLGTRGLHDSLINLKSLDVSRNYKDPKQLGKQSPGVILFSGIPSKWTILGAKSLSKDLKMLAAQGNRVVMTFSIFGKWSPVEDEEAADEDTKEEPDEEISEESRNQTETSDTETIEPEEISQAQDEELSANEQDNFEEDLTLTDQDTVEKDLSLDDQNTQEEEESSLDEEKEDQELDPRVKKIREFLKIHEKESGKDTWGLTLNQSKGARDHLGTALISPEFQDSGLTPVMDWHSSWFFEDLSHQWKTIYTKDGQAVMVERKMGKGALVFVSESFFLSNEALAADPPAELLVWLLGTHDRVVFDEWHMGIAKQDGISTLAQKYGLAGAGAALLVWALLYLWHNAAPLVPRKSADPSAKDNREHISTRGYAEAMASLLRRNVPPAQALKHCLTLWEGSAIQNKRISPEVKREVRNAILTPENPGQKESVEAYNRAVEILSRER